MSCEAHAAQLDFSPEVKGRDLYLVLVDTGAWSVALNIKVCCTEVNPHLLPVESVLGDKRAAPLELVREKE